MSCCPSADCCDVTSRDSLDAFSCVRSMTLEQAWSESRVLYDTFIRRDSVQEVNISSGVRDQLTAVFVPPKGTSEEAHRAAIHLTGTEFDRALLEIKGLLSANLIAR